ncbi:MAG: hypothetical protein WCO84_01945 [bacterium]
MKNKKTQDTSGIVLFIIILSVLGVFMIFNQDTNSNNSSTLVQPSAQDDSSTNNNNIDLRYSDLPVQAVEDFNSIPVVETKIETTKSSVSSVSGGSCIHSGEVKFTIAEETRMKEIMVSVLQGDASIPTSDAVYNEFWSIMDRHGRLCEEDLVLTRDVGVFTQECNRLFYQDALYSLRMGQVYKSPERLDCENKTILRLLPEDKADVRIRANEVLMNKIANGEPIATPRGNVIFTEEIIQATLGDLIAKLEKINKLFTR